MSHGEYRATAAPSVAEKQSTSHCSGPSGLFPRRYGATITTSPPPSPRRPATRTKVSIRLYQLLSGADPFVKCLTSLFHSLGQSSGIASRLRLAYLDVPTLAINTASTAFWSETRIVQYLNDKLDPAPKFIARRMIRLPRPAACVFSRRLMLTAERPI